MIVLGIVLIVLGLILPSLVPTFAFAHLCFVIGVLLLVVGLILFVAGRAGHAVGGRRHYHWPAGGTARPVASSLRDSRPGSRLGAFGGLTRRGDGLRILSPMNVDTRNGNSKQAQRKGRN